MSEPTAAVAPGSVRRVMGIETEYGVTVPRHPLVDPVVLSCRVVQRYAAAGDGQAHRARWDYAGESPLDDARGFTLGRALAHESQLTDEWADDATLLVGEGPLELGVDQHDAPFPPAYWRGAWH